MSPRQLFNAIDGWKDKQEWTYRRQWEQARYIAKAIVSVQVQKKDKGKLDKAFRLPWDDGARATKAVKLSPEELKRQEEETIRIARKVHKILG